MLVEFLESFGKVIWECKSAEFALNGLAEPNP